MIQILLIIIGLGVVANLVLWFLTGKKDNFSHIKNFLENFDKNLGRTENSLRDEFGRNREEFSRSLKDSREELTNALERVRTTVEEKLKNIQQDNSAQLEKMRATVDEKLHKTLEDRLGQSFKLVQERLEVVHQGLGEMQKLATGVGDLKKVLSNVKTRGILGEIQLENILEQILTPEQYEKNVVTKKGSREVVEFAVRMPGKDDSGKGFYLPIDSKFPLENYQALQDAYEKADPAAVEEAGKEFDSSIKKCAKDIRDKYLDPPHTTDFGILFLPIEGLYAEVLRRKGLWEVVRRDFEVVIVGPTILSAFLNSLQMGFRTLLIEKRSSEVWRVLGAVKNEFKKFGEVLEKAQEKINQASTDIENLVGARTKQIQRKLKDIQEVSPKEAKLLLEAVPLDVETSQENHSEDSASE